MLSIESTVNNGLSPKGLKCGLARGSSVYLLSFCKVRYFWEKQYCSLVLKLLYLAPQLKITTNGELHSEQQQQQKTWKILLLWTQDLWHGQMAKHLNWKTERSLVIELKLD